LSRSNIRFEEQQESEPIVWPARVEKTIQLYSDASKQLAKIGRKIDVKYIPTTEDLLERIFER
jgi:hypothetical protein